MPCGWEGNRRSGVALATRQTFVVLHLRAQGLEEGDEHPPVISYGTWSTLPYLTADCTPTVVPIFGMTPRHKFCLHCFDTVGWASGRASGL